MSAAWSTQHGRKDWPSDSAWYLSGMLRRALLPLACIALGCSSSNFEVVNNEDSSTFEETSNETSTNEETSVADSAPVDSKPDPCAPEAGKAKFCINLAKPLEHPPYTTDEAKSLALNGKGRFYLYVYDKDPIANKTAMPIATIPYPSDAEVGAEVNIDTDLPLTIPGSIATPGVYTIVVLFVDSTKPRGKGTAGILPGDFVSYPTISGMKASYPTMTLSMDKTENVPVVLRPVRAVTLTLDPDDGSKTKGPTVNGDGPAFFGLTDNESITDLTAWLQLDVAGCVDLQMRALSPRPQDIVFPTVVEPGLHNLWAGVIDYDPLDPRFPGRGTLVSTQNSPLPKVDLKNDSWTATARATLIQLAFGAVAATKVDMTRCPTSM